MMTLVEMKIEELGFRRCSNVKVELGSTKVAILVNNSWILLSPDKEGLREAIFFDKGKIEIKKGCIMGSYCSNNPEMEAFDGRILHSNKIEVNKCVGLRVIGSSEDVLVLPIISLQLLKDAA